MTFSNPLSGTVLPGNISGRTFGSRATYRCPHGSHVVGLQSRLCQAYGHWSGTEPSCKMNSECLDFRKPNYSNNERLKVLMLASLFILE